MSNVKLIAVTKPVLDGCETAEELISYCARVSNPDNQRKYDTAGKLLRYMLKHKHFSPFEMAHMVMEIKTTRDIARQILRHRSFSFQEYSQRYAAVTPDSFVLSEARLQDKFNRQNSIEVSDKALLDWWTLNQGRLLDMTIALYNTALEKGIAKEVARKVLPEGITGSVMYMSGTVRSFIHYCDVRRKSDTQLEHRLIANEVWDILCQQFPTIPEALEMSDE
jgi:thymidylate synthase (FAD)